MNMLLVVTSIAIVARRSSVGIDTVHRQFLHSEALVSLKDCPSEVTKKETKSFGSSTPYQHFQRLPILDQTLPQPLLLRLLHLPLLHLKAHPVHIPHHPIFLRITEGYISVDIRVHVLFMTNVVHLS